MTGVGLRTMSLRACFDDTLLRARLQREEANVSSTSTMHCCMYCMYTAAYTSTIHLLHVLHVYCCIYLDDTMLHVLLHRLV